MKKHFRTLVVGTAALLLLAQGALADSISFNGTIGVSDTEEIYAPVGGTVDSVDVIVGQRVRAGETIATIATTKVYAAESGTVTGIFGQPGDSAETVANHYGAVMYIEGESKYTIAASTENAYNTTANKYVRVGETVYLSCYSDGSHTGTGIITAIEGTDYTVEVLSGDFLVGETVSVYRASSYKATARIGRGTLSRRNPIAVTGTGSIVAFAVADGDAVERGDLLFETLDGSFDGLYMSGCALKSGVDGYIAQINIAQGDKLNEDSVAAVVYPLDEMRIEADVTEYNLSSIAEGDKVSIELLWNQDEEITYEGTIAMISGIGTATEEAVSYKVYIDFAPDSHTRYGMSAVVNTLDADEAVNIMEGEVEP